MGFYLRAREPMKENDGRDPPLPTIRHVKHSDNLLALRFENNGFSHIYLDYFPFNISSNFASFSRFSSRSCLRARC